MTLDSFNLLLEYSTWWKRRMALFQCPGCGGVVGEVRDSKKAREFHIAWHEARQV